MSIIIINGCNYLTAMSQELKGLLLIKPLEAILVCYIKKRKEVITSNYGRLLGLSIHIPSLLLPPRLLFFLSMLFCPNPSYSLSSSLNAISLGQLGCVSFALISSFSET